jgi:GT2 family glycosyltransferase
MGSIKLFYIPFTGRLHMLTAVIPTRNRPIDLAKAVTSVCAQTSLPDELIIIDQSLSNESSILVRSLVQGVVPMQLIYIHDANISGLVEAKHVAANISKSDIICFLEDDIVLEPEYFEEIKKGFDDQPSMIGCCGFITNVPQYSYGYKFFFNLFHRGIFEDRRLDIYEKCIGRQNRLIACNTLSGGASAWRREVFYVIPFDIANGFHMLEDIDFSTRVAMHYGERLYINTDARLEHYSSPINREVLGPRQRRKLIEYIIYYKKRRNQNWATLSFLWLLFGLFLEAVVQTASSRSLTVIKGFFSGVREGFFRKVIHQNLQSSVHLS